MVARGVGQSTWLSEDQAGLHALQWWLGVWGTAHGCQRTRQDCMRCNGGSGCGAEHVAVRGPDRAACAAMVARGGGQSTWLSEDQTGLHALQWLLTEWA
eukprot:364434-Chlamydomonas_euryale.AAC.11